MPALPFLRIFLLTLLLSVSGAFSPVSHSFEPPPLYRPRNARASPLYQLLETYYEDFKAIWEDRFQKKFGFWRGFVDTVVARFLDCGVAEGGFARLRCDTCKAEKLLT